MIAHALDSKKRRILSMIILGFSVEALEVQNVLNQDDAEADCTCYHNDGNNGIPTADYSDYSPYEENNQCCCFAEYPNYYPVPKLLPRISVLVQTTFLPIQFNPTEDSECAVDC